MRRGDFGVEIIPSSGANVRELETGQVLARPGTVYRLRLRNFGPLHAVVAVEIDGRTITSGGLVLRPWSYTDLERPLDDGETGRFTVAAEGDEKVFGPDGGRDNDELGLIHASFRRELPSGRPHHEFPDGIAVPMRPMFGDDFRYRSTRIDALMSPGGLVFRDAPADIERAAGTGLTGHSDQQFVPATLGPLEDEATVIQLRLVIGSVAAIALAPATTTEAAAPARPAARP
jgi:hypothetical protein